MTLSLNQDSSGQPHLSVPRNILLETQNAYPSMYNQRVRWAYFLSGNTWVQCAQAYGHVITMSLHLMR